MDEKFDEEYNSQDGSNNEEIPEEGNFRASPKNEQLNGFKNNFNPLKQNPISNNGFNKKQFNNSNIGKQNAGIQNPANKVKQEAIAKGAKAAANAVAGPLAGAAVEALAKSELAQKALNTASNNLSNNSLPTNNLMPFSPFKKKKKKSTEEEGTGDQAADITKKIIGFGVGGTFGFGGCLTGIIIIVLVAIIISPLFYVNELVNTAGDALSSFGEKLGNFLTFRGWCSDEECQENEQFDFYNHIDEVYEEYVDEKGVKLNVTLLTATLTYADPFTTIDDEEIDNFEDLVSSNYLDFKKSEKKVDELAARMVSYCCYKNGEEYLTSDGKHMCQRSNKIDYSDINYACPDDVYKEIDGEEVLVEDYEEKYKVDTDRYEEYLREEFIRKFYYDNKDDENTADKVDNTIDEIFARVAMYEDSINKKGFVKVYAYCSGITVTDKSGNIMGTYDLEDYVAGVVRHEVAGNQSEEVHKALAIAARTYALKATNNCTLSIENSTRAQTVDIQDVDDYASKAANATSGKVLIYNDQIFASQYDSFCYNNDDCNYGEEDGKLYVDYTKLPNGEQHRVYLSKEYENYINGGHGRGMSQVVAYEMADNGSSYLDILKFFYSDGVSVVDMVTTYGDYISSSEIPLSAEQLKEKSDYYASLGVITIGTKTFNANTIYYGTAGNLGQCVWYARSRALELILTSNMDDETKIAALEAINNVRANGSGWFDAQQLSIFEKSTDSSMPVPGAIVSWSGGSDKCSPGCGHVAIVESVDYENQTITVSGGFNKEGPYGEPIWENVGYETETYTFETIKYYSDANRYTFNGYVYILGKGD